MNEIINDGYKHAAMTDEEAAQILKTSSIYLGRRNGKERFYTAMMKAIKALEASGKEIDVLYLCDRNIEGCPKTNCSSKYCSCTTDINHAINFNKYCDFEKKDGSKYLCFAEKHPWIEITSRPGTEEEYQDFLYRGGDCPREDFRVYTSELPEHGQEVLITTSWGDVVIDIFYNDVDSCYFENHEDPDEVIAWMPKPEGFKPEVPDANN